MAGVSHKTSGSPSCVITSDGQAKAYAAGKTHHIKLQGDRQYLVSRQLNGHHEAVVAMRVGDDLVLLYADGTRVVMEGYFVQLEGAAEVVIQSGADAAGYAVPSVTAESGASGAVVADVSTAEGSSATMLYASGEKAGLLDIATKQPGLLDQFAGSLDKLGDTDLFSWSLPLDISTGSGIGLWGVVGGLVAAGGVVAAVSSSGGDSSGGSSSGDSSSGGGETSPGSTIITGVVTAGPLIAGHGLSVAIYAADGTTLLGTAPINETGRFTCDVGAYSGAVIARLIDFDGGSDYMDEATRTGRDLSDVTLMTVATVASGQTVTLNINPLTTVAARLAGLNAGGTGSVDADTVVEANKKVSEEFGLNDIINDVVTTVIAANGSPQTGNDYGKILAGLSGMDQANGGNSGTTIDSLYSDLNDTDGTLSDATQNKIIAGSADADVDPQVINDLLSDDTETPTLSLSLASSSVEENAAYSAPPTLTGNSDGTVTYTLSGADADKFSVNPSNGVVTFKNAPDYENPLDYGSNNVYAYTLIATDASSNTASVAVAVTVTDLDEVAPIITSGDTATAIVENTGAGTVVYTATATDLVDTSAGVTLSLSGTDADKFSFNAATGEVTLLANANYETKSSYSFTVVATDAAGNSSEKAVTLAINDVDESDVTIPVDSNTATNTVAENATNGTTVGVTASASDADGTTNTVTYSLAAGVTDNNLFLINAATGVVTLNGALDYDSATQKTITVTASSTDGSTSTQVFTINVTDVDEFNVAFATTPDSDTADNTVAENATNGTTVGVTASASDADGTTNTVTYSLVGDAEGSDYTAGEFAIDPSSGVVTVAGTINYEAGATRTLYVKATSADGSDAIQGYTINVTDVNEFSVTTPVDSNTATNTVAENATNGTTVGVTASASDADGTTNTVTYSLVANEEGDAYTAGEFAIDPSSGEVTVAGTINYEAGATRTLYVKATSADGSDAIQGYTINVTDVNEFSVTTPVDSNTATNTVAENATNGTTVGVTASASDADGTTNAVTYSLVANEEGDAYTAGEFAIGAGNGVVTVAGTIDYEAGATRTLYVKAASADGSSAIQSYTINVTDVNDAPVNTVPEAQTVDEDTSLAITGISVSDQDNNLASTQLSVGHGVLTVTLAGGASISTGSNGSSTLTISGTQAAINTTLASLHYQGTSNFNGSDTLTVLSTDSSGTPLTDTDTVSITVNPVNDAPTASATSISVLYNTTKTGNLPVASDVDTGNTLSYAKVDGPAHGSVTVDANGSYSYIPTTNYSGGDSFTYHVTDGAGGASNTYTVNVSVAANSNPTLSAANQVGTLVEAGFAGVGTATASITLSKADSNNNDAASYDQNAMTTTGGWTTGNNGATYTKTGTYGTAILTAATNSVSYSLDNSNSATNALAASASATDSFTVYVKDTTTGTASAAVNFAITGANDAPTANDASGIPVAYNTAYNDSLTLIASDVDTDDTLSYVKVDGPDHGSVTVNDNGNYSYTPATGHSGSDSFTYRVTDAAGVTSSTHMVNLAVAANSNPTLSAGSQSEVVVEDGTATATITLTKADSNALDTASYNQAAMTGAGWVTNDSGATYTKTGTYGTATLTTTNDQVSYALNNSDSDTNALAANASVTDSFTVYVKDTTTGTASAAVNFAITGANDAPTASNASISVAYNTPEHTGNLPVASDVDTGNTLISYAKVADPAHGSVTVNANGSYSYTPATGHSGSDSFTYKVTDSAGTASNTYTVTITVSDNITPTLSAAAQVGALVEDGAAAATITLTKADSDASDAASYDQTAMTGAGWATNDSGATYTKTGTYGTATLTTINDQVSYSLDNNDSDTNALATGVGATDSFTVYVKDTTTGTASAAVNFAITGANDAPTLTAGSQSAPLVEAGTAGAGTAAATITLTRSDSDSGDVAAYDQSVMTTTGGWATSDNGATYSKTGTYGTAILTAATNVVSYALDNNDTDTRSLVSGSSVTDSFDVYVKDTSSDTASAAVNFAISGADDGPVNTVPGAQTVDEDTSLAISGISVSDQDNNLASTQLSVEHGVLTVTLAEGATISVGNNGTSALTISGSQAAINATLASLSYQGASNYHGSDTLTVLSTDSSGTPLTDSDTVSITVNSVNDAPTLGTLSDAVIYEKVNATGVDSDRSAHTSGDLYGTDADGDTLTYGIRDAEGNQVAVNTSNKVVLYGASGKGYLWVSPNSPDGLYQFSADYSTIDTLDSGESVTDSYTVTVTDNSVVTTATIQVTYHGEDDQPLLYPVTSGSVAEEATANTTTDANLSGTLSGSDIDGDTLTYGIYDISGVTLSNGLYSKAGTYGTLSVTSATGAYTYAKNAVVIEALDTLETKSDSFQVWVSDGDGASVYQTYAVNLSGANDAPTLAAVTSGSVTEVATANTTTDDNLSGVLSGSDIDGETLTYGVQGGSDNENGTYSMVGTYGVLTVTTATGAYTYAKNTAAIEALAAGTSTNDSFTVTVTDGDATATSNFNVTLTGNNDAPTVANAIDDQNATEDSLFSFTVPTNTFSDVDAGAILSYTATLADGSALPGWLSFDGSTRIFSGTPTNEHVGTISVKVTATDGNSASVSDTFTLTVANTNDAPTVANAMADTTVTENVAFSFAMSLNTFSDVDAGDSLTYSATLANGDPLPAWLSFSAATCSFSGTAPNGVDPFSVKVTATDSGSMSISDEFTLTVNDTNQTPTVAHLIEDQSATEDTGFSFQVPSNSFSDGDSETLSYSATLASGDPLPAWLSFNATNQTFSGTPLNEHVGSIDVKVTATDPKSASISDEFTLTVVNTNDAPTVAHQIVDQSGRQDAVFSFNVPANTFADVDTTDSLTYTATLANGDSWPTWLSFNTGTRTFSGTPLEANVGTITVKVTATDGSSASISDEFTLVVEDSNHTPTVDNPIADQSGRQETEFNFEVPSNTFSDVDADDSLHYSASLADGSELPDWLTFTAATRTFSGTPLDANVGPINVKVTATDSGGKSASDIFILTVANTPESITVEVPEATNSINAAEASNGVAVNITLPSDAVAGDIITVSIDNSDAVTHTVTAANISAGSATVTLPSTDISNAGQGDAIITTTYKTAGGLAATNSPVTSSVSIDTIAPTITIAAPLEGDNVINATEDNDVVVSGTTTADVGRQVTVTLSDGTNSVTKYAMVESGGNWALTGAAIPDISSFADGNITITADVSDAAGNPATQATTTVTHDTVAKGFVIRSVTDSDFGFSVSSAGDVNGDGLTDLIIGAKIDLSNAAGRSYVVFGKADGTVVQASDIASGTGGFVINGESASDYSGYSVSGAGDVNGDGLADLIVGAYVSDYNGTSAGRSYVIFGKTDGTPVNLTAIADGTGTDGFVINAYTNSLYSGISVSSAGDMNGDGLDDLIIGAIGVSSSTGAAYVVYGKTSATAVNLAAITAGNGADGFVINGVSTINSTGNAVSSAGDVNGDGLADLIVGAFKNDTVATDAGRSYVVFGRTDSQTTVNLSSLSATEGFVINGISASDYTGISVSSAGDVNGDGLADLIVGAYGSDYNGSLAGRSYVVFGKSDGTTVNLTAMTASTGGTGGFVINGRSANDYSGYSVSGAGDVNGDGLADLIVGAYSSAVGANNGVGLGYVVFGKTDTNSVDLSTIDFTSTGTNGFLIYAENAGGSLGMSVSGGGDINGDGLADLIIGQSYKSSSSPLESSYVVFGKADGKAVNMADVAAGGSAAHSISHTGTTGNDTWTGTANAEIALGGAGNDVLAGNGGSDVLYGGAGDDTLVINADNVSALKAEYGSGGNTDLLARVDGGLGFDTLRLSGTSIDLTQIANQAAGDSETGSRIAGIERIDLATDTNANTLTLSVKDVLDMSGMNQIHLGLSEDGHNWSNSTNSPLTDTVAKHQLVITGDSGDSVTLSDASNWSSIGNVSNGSSTYTVYNHNDSAAQLLIQQGVTVMGVQLSQVESGVGGFVINGVDASDGSGYSVSSAGDVNGDGLADLIVGAYGADLNGSASGASYVVFGKTGGTAVELSNLGDGGFVITGAAPSDWSGSSVSTAGDVNGDGLADLIVGADGGDPDGKTDAGRSYVVFGKTSITAVELSSLGDGGFVINGVAESDGTGYSGSSAGDVNGDGLADLIVGAYGAENYTGASYVVFGKTGGTAVELSNLNAGGFVINGVAESDGSGISVSSAGDVNGDGLADLIVGADWANSSTGASYVVFGKTSITAVELSSLGNGGFIINGVSEEDGNGTSVSSAGDVNGDGLADLIVGAYGADPNGLSGAGSSYVVFGKTTGTAVNLSNFATSDGFVINGGASGDNSGISVSSAGDVNGDGLADLIVGAYGADPNGLSGAGSSYVVFGKTTGTAVNLSNFATSDGFVINGGASGDNSGISVSSAGDVNGDGLADLIVGVYKADDYTGASYVIFGSTAGDYYQTAVDTLGTNGNDTLTGDSNANVLVGGGGNDTLTGGGGADVLYGGSGDDTFVIDGSMITALDAGFGAGGNDNLLSRIDGGTGFDVIQLSGSGLDFDLTAIANVMEGSRIESIEKIDLTGNGDNSLKLHLDDVLDMAGMNLIHTVTASEDGHEWSNLNSGTALTDTVAKHQLVVDGNTGDGVTFTGSNGDWASAGQAQYTSGDTTYTYDVYNHNSSAAQVLINHAINSVGLPT